MNRRLILAMSIAILLALAALTGLASARNGGYSLAWWTVDGGGGSSSAPAGYSLSGSAGQPDAGVLSGGSYQIAGGFWAAGSTAAHIDPTPTPIHNHVYLPMVTH